MPNPCELCRQQMLELLPPRDVSTHFVETQTADETLRAELEAHMATCPECAREWTRLQNMTQALHNIPMMSAPVDLRARIRSQIVDEQTSKKSFWQSLTFRPQRVAWAGSVVVGGLLFALATQQPIEFYSSSPVPPASSGQFDVAQEPESSLRLEEKKVQKPAPKVIIGKPGATNSKSRTPATAPNPIAGGANAPAGTNISGSINRAANAPARIPASADSEPDASTDTSASPSLRPAPPGMLPSAPVLPPDELRRVTPAAAPSTTRPRNQAVRPSVQQSAAPASPTRRDVSTQKPSVKSAKIPSVAPRNTTPELFSDAKPATQPTSPKKPSTPPQPRKPNFNNDSSFSAPAPMAKSAPETMMAPPVTRAETREGTQNGNQESEPKTASSPGAQAPSAIGPKPGAQAAPEPRESARTRAGMSAMRSAPARDDQKSAAGGASENFATHHEADAAPKQRVVVVATRFIPSRDVKTARLRVVLPSGATLASPSTQDLVVWQGRARAGIAIPITMSVRTDSGSDLQLVLEEKRGSSWRSVQERTIAIEP